MEIVCTKDICGASLKSQSEVLIRALLSIMHHALVFCIRFCDVLCRLLILKACSRVSLYIQSCKFLFYIILIPSSQLFIGILFLFLSGQTRVHARLRNLFVRMIIPLQEFDLNTFYCLICIRGLILHLIKTFRTIPILDITNVLLKIYT